MFLNKGGCCDKWLNETTEIFGAVKSQHAQQSNHLLLLLVHFQSSCVVKLLSSNVRTLYCRKKKAKALFTVNVSIVQEAYLLKITLIIALFCSGVS